MAYIVGAVLLCILFWVVAAGAIIRAGKWSNRMERELELHAPLLYVFFSYRLCLKRLWCHGAVW